MSQLLGCMMDSLTKDMPYMETAKGVIPFLVFFPVIALGLVHWMG